MHVTYYYTNQRNQSAALFCSIFFSVKNIIAIGQGLEISVPGKILKVLF